MLVTGKVRVATVPIQMVAVVTRPLVVGWHDATMLVEITLHVPILQLRVVVKCVLVRLILYSSSYGERDFCLQNSKKVEGRRCQTH